MTPLDLTWLLLGYLWSADGTKITYVHGLEQIAYDIERFGASVWWADEREPRAAYCRWRERRIVLAPWLHQADGWYVRYVLSEELAHSVVGPDEQRARLWQTERYGELVTAPAWMA